MKKIYSLVISVFFIVTGVVHAQTMDWVNLQFPSSFTVAQGNSATVYTQGYEPGLTPGAGAGAGVLVWIGVSTSNTNPNTWTSWMPAVFNVDVGNNDEYMVNLGGNLAPGTYYYASRWQLNGGAFVYGGLSGLWVAGQSGVLTVNPDIVPANNECAAALFLTSTGSTSYTSLGATQSRTPEACNAVTAAAARDVWFKFTPASSGTITITLDNVTAQMDATMIAYAGTCAALTNIGCSNATGANGNEVLILNGLNAGQTYFVRVYGNNLFNGSFRIYVSSGALPISVKYLTGTKRTTGNHLDWSLECSNSFSATMVLERSADARNFFPIYQLTESATRCQQPFSFTDVSALPGVNYYRLKTIEIDGKTSYSPIVALLNQERGFEIVGMYPNPASEKALLEITSAEPGEMKILISDMTGKQLYGRVILLKPGNNQLVLPLGQLSSGTYLLSGFDSKGISRNFRFVKL